MSKQLREIHDSLMTARTDSIDDLLNATISLVDAVGAMEQRLVGVVALAEVRRTVDALPSIIETLRHGHAALAETSREHDEEIKLHTSALDRCVDRLDRLEARSPIEALDRRIEELTTERDRWRRLHNERTVKLGEIEDKLNAAEVELSSLRPLLAEAEQERDGACAELGELRAALADTVAARDEAVRIGEALACRRPDDTTCVICGEMLTRGHGCRVLGTLNDIREGKWRRD